MSDWTHDGLLSDLAGYLRGPDTLVWEDMQLGPSGSPRPDVFMLRKSYSKPNPTAFEVKVSRSDLRSDTTSGKWQSYLKYAGSVTFAVPDGLCTVADIPDSCGLIVRKDQVWRYTRRPTIQAISAIPRDAWMKLLIDGVSRVSRQQAPQPRRIETWRENKAVRLKFGEAVELAARDLLAVEKRIADMKLVADQEFARVRKEADERKQYLLEQAKRSISEWEGAKREICEWLDVDPQTIGAHAIRKRISEMRSSCDADARVQEADRKLAAARNGVQNALSTLGAA